MAIHKSLVNLFIITILNISWVVIDAVLYLGVKIASVYANVPFTLIETSDRTWTETLLHLLDKIQSCR